MTDTSIEAVLRYHITDGQVFDHSNDTVIVNRTLLRAAADEIERLRRFLSIAIDDHDDARGEVNPEARPNHWTVQARALCVPKKS